MEDYSTIGTRDDIARQMEEYFERVSEPHKNRSITIHLGARGKGMFDWSMSAAIGSIDRSRSHARLVRLISRHEAVDINREVWKWEVSGGHVQWERMCTLIEIYPRNSRGSRFNQWEQSLQHA